MVAQNFIIKYGSTCSDMKGEQLARDYISVNKARNPVYLVGLHRPFIFTEPYFGVERKTKEESGAYLFEISDVC